MDTGGGRRKIADKNDWYVKVGERSVYGPFPLDELRDWALSGRFHAWQPISLDQKDWQYASGLSSLNMDWTVEGVLTDERSFPLAVAGTLLKRGKIAAGSHLVNRRTGKRLSADAWEAGGDPSKGAALDHAADAAQKDLLQELERVRQSNLVLVQKCEDLGFQLKLSEKRYSECSETLMHATEKRCILQDELEQSNARLSSLEDEHASVSSAKLALEEQLASESDAHRASLEEAVRRADASASALAASEKTLSDLRERLSSLEREHASVSSAKLALEEQLASESDAHRASLEEAVGRADASASALAASEKTLSDLRERLSSLESEHASVSSAKSALEEQLASESDADHASLEEALRRADASASALAASEKTLSDLRERLSFLGDEKSAVDHAGLDEQEEWYLQLEDGQAFGPVQLEKLAEWATHFRIGPGHKVSTDQKDWQPAHTLDALHMDWTIKLEDGEEYGPIHFLAAKEVIRDGIATEHAEMKHCRTGFVVQADRLMHEEMFAIITQMDEQMRAQEQEIREQKELEAKTRVLQERLQALSGAVDSAGNDAAGSSLPPKSIGARIKALHAEASESEGE